MAEQSNNITHLIQHRALLNSRNLSNHQTMDDYMNNNPSVHSFYCPDNRVGGNFTHEFWRQFWLTATMLCYDVREQGYVLNKDTFAYTNMVVVDHYYLRFKQLFGVMGTDDQSEFEDFRAVANFIEESANGENMPDEVTMLLDRMRRSRVHDNPMDFYSKAFIKCNYAFMKDSLRISFLMAVGEYSRWPSSPLFNDATYICCRGHPYWQGQAKFVRNSPLELVYREKAKMYDKSGKIGVIKYIRKALVHMTDYADYIPQHVLQVLTCCFDWLVPTLQYELCMRTMLVETLYMYQPSTN